MISEEMLKKAAAEADQAIRDSLPAPADCKHEFSPSFQRKMRRTFRKANHPVIYKLPKYAACFVLVIALAGGTWLTVDVEARAAFFAWVREQYEAFVEYRFIGEAPQESEIIVARKSVYQNLGRIFCWRSCLQWHRNGIERKNLSVNSRCYSCRKYTTESFYPRNLQMIPMWRYI